MVISVCISTQRAQRTQRDEYFYYRDYERSLTLFTEDLPPLFGAPALCVGSIAAL